jgi:hypothetical protein
MMSRKRRWPISQSTWQTGCCDICDLAPSSERLKDFLEYLNSIHLSMKSGEGQAHKGSNKLTYMPPTCRGQVLSKQIMEASTLSQKEKMMILSKNKTVTSS